MDSGYAIINKDFGTKQLSGNESMYKRLLQRFVDEYQNSEQKLAEFKQLNNHEAMQIHVHTIKGVSGNLGLDHLHQIAKRVDAQLKEANSTEIDLQDLIAGISVSIEHIANYTSENQSTAGEGTTATQSATTQSFVDALKQQRFISDDMLHQFFAQSNLTEQQRQAVSDAIDDLDYAQALNVIVSG